MILETQRPTYTLEDGTVLLLLPLACVMPMLQFGIINATACTPLLLSKLLSLPLAVNLTVSVVTPVAADAVFDGAFDIATLMTMTAA